MGKSYKKPFKKVKIIKKKSSIYDDINESEVEEIMGELDDAEILEEIQQEE